MRRRTGIAVALGIAAAVSSLMGSDQARAGKIAKGTRAPAIDLACAGGKRVSSEGLGDLGLSLVTFVSLDSKPSRELVVALSGMLRRHSGAGMSAVAIASDSPDALGDFAKKLDLGFPVCSDPDKKVMASWGADEILPITYVVGPGSTVATVIPGGGMSAQQVLMAVAEKELARGNAETAGALYAEVKKADPSNPGARAGEAIALVKQGKLERAQEELKQLSSGGGEAARVASAGLADVALRKGDVDGAERALAKAPSDDAYAKIVRGEVAAARGNIDQASKAFREASVAKASFGWQTGVALNNLARISAEKGDTATAVQGYDRAIEAEPFLAAARSNKAVTLDRAGRRAEAKETFATARSLAPNDQLVATLLRRMEEQDKASADVERQKLTSQLVDDLVAAYKSGKTPPKPEDDWSPRALVVSLIDLESKLPITAPAGLGDAFLAALTVRLQETGRIKVVEREIIDKLLTELKLGASDLADSSTRLKLGRVLAASVIGTGGLFPAGSSTQLQLRLIDTETTDIKKTLSATLSQPSQVASFAGQVADQIAAALLADYPLRGKIADIVGREITVGIGSKHGARAGMRLKVVEDGAPVEVDGEILGKRQKAIGSIEITSVEDGFSTAKPVEGGPFSKGQHLTEDKR